MVTDGPITSDTFQLRDARLHFVGVGGSGMSGLARMAASRGAICTGSDLNDSDAIADLRAAGVAVTLEQNADSLPGECDIVVVSAAIGQDHPEVVAALERNIRIVKYAQMLGRLMHNRTGVAIAGTHGKSSTTSMLCHVLLATQRDPSFIIGARCEQLAGGSRAGDSDILVAEACEYDRSFHNYHPRHGVILNIEEDHLDYYAGLEAIVESFATFARQVQPDGSLLMQHESPHRLAVTAGLDCKIESIGFAPQADWQVDKQNGDTLLKHQRQIVAQWRSPLPGEHMAYNAAVAVVTAHRLGVPWEDAAGAIANFRGLDRRMQKLGAMKGVADVTIIDDYGHHPTEVETTLRALRAHYQPERLICVSPSAENASVPTTNITHERPVDLHVTLNGQQFQPGTYEPLAFHYEPTALLLTLYPPTGPVRGGTTLLLSGVSLQPVEGHAIVKFDEVPVLECQLPFIFTFVDIDPVLHV